MNVGWHAPSLTISAFTAVSFGTDCPFSAAANNPNRKTGAEHDKNRNAAGFTIQWQGAVILILDTLIDHSHGRVPVCRHPSVTKSEQRCLTGSTGRPLQTGSLKISDDSVPIRRQKGNYLRFSHTIIHYSARGLIGSSEMDITGTRGLTRESALHRVDSVDSVASGSI